MNPRIKQLANTADILFLRDGTIMPGRGEADIQKFAELLVAKVLDEVAERAYSCGDRAWSDKLDRRWVELEFGFGKLAELNDEN